MIYAPQRIVHAKVCIVFNVAHLYLTRINFVIRYFTRGEKVAVMSFSGSASSFTFKYVQVVLGLSFKRTLCDIFVENALSNSCKMSGATSIC